MSMSGYYLGIDLGTSSVKVLATDGKNTVKAKRGYAEISVHGWLVSAREAVRETVGKLENAEICAVGLSSQVGTYIIDGKEVVSWNEAGGRVELNELKERITQEEFVQAISMEHPDIVSYPLPRLCYIKKKKPSVQEVVMPKELLGLDLTGELSTDIFSQRGIASFQTGDYAQGLLEKLGLDGIRLPNIQAPTEKIGFVTDEAEKNYGLKKGTPVYLGCNDFFAGLLGMGVLNEGTVFELSGTSEHLGVITKERLNGVPVSGNYLENFVSYGGTKGSGVACSFAIENFGVNGLDEKEILKQNPPIFLPYLTGERAPIFDENARGVFFGLNAKTDKKQLAYAVLEGVVFSLYDIYLTLGQVRGSMIAGGGSVVNEMMTRLKAELFEKEIVCVEENDVSALGAAMLAMVGNGRFASLQEAVEKTVRYKEPVQPTGELTEILKKRFGVYRNLYQSLKNNFLEFSQINFYK